MSMSFPAIRENQDCGTDDNILSGREPIQLGWYEWAKSYYQDMNVLDIGCGSGLGIGIMKSNGAASVTGQDIDSRLLSLNDRLLICNVFEIEDKSFDVVTCFDVIEHVTNDIDFFEKIRKIAKKTLIITTPNYLVSEARNRHHCREYTPAQFYSYFNPTELWGGSSDGKREHKQISVGENVLLPHLCGIWSAA